MLEGLEKIRNPSERRSTIERALDGGYQVTEVLLLPKAVSVEVQEIILGIIKDSAGRPMHTGNGRYDQIRLMSVDGRPLGAVKVGQQPHSISTGKLAEMEARGESPDIMVQYGADFDVLPERAIMLLHSMGYGVASRRWRCRSASSRKEKDAHGRDVKAIDEWRLIERGSRFAAQAASELVTRARGEMPEYPDIDRTESRRLLARALEISPGHTGAQAALDAMGADEPTRKGRAA